jgi:hypothetical protein
MIYQFLVFRVNTAVGLRLLKPFWEGARFHLLVELIF